MVENHMVVNAPDAPWNRPDMGSWECSCGVDHFDQAFGRYPLWHAEGKYLEECTACGKRCCHECGAECRICGKYFCPECQKGFHKDLRLCEGCAAQYGVFAPHRNSADVEALIQLERRRARHPHSYHGTPTDSEVTWLIERLKDAWEALAEIRFQKEVNRGNTSRNDSRVAAD